MRQMLIIGMTIFMVQNVFSMPSQKPLKLANGIQSALSKSFSDRLAWLKESDLNQELMAKVAFENKYHLQDRWAAFQSIAALKNKIARQSIIKASKSDDWFMRDAAMKASRKFYPKASKKLARKLLQDPSLIVRTSAVKTLHQAGDKSSAPLLWEALYDEKNFRKGRSLWVRKYIVRALVDFEAKNTGNVNDEHLEKYIKLLKENTPDIQSSAILALAQMTNKSFGSKQTPVELQRERWLQWWEQK